LGLGSCYYVLTETTHRSENIMNTSLLQNVKILGGAKVLQVYEVKVESSSEVIKFDGLADQNLTAIVESGQVFALIENWDGQWYAHYHVDGAVDTCLGLYDSLYSIPDQLFN
jgi:hypothetical protein